MSETYQCNDEGSRVRVWQCHEMRDAAREVEAGSADGGSTDHDLDGMAALDPLTGAYTRTAWESRANAEFKRLATCGKPLSIAIFDLDRMKTVNDAHGYSVGDEVICRFAELCLERRRDADVVGRFGGEEFVLLLPETPCQTALSIVEQLRISFSEKPLQLKNGADLLVTVSAGLTASRGREASVKELLCRVDQALLGAKRSDRNCTIVDDLIPLEPCD